MVYTSLVFGDIPKNPQIISVCCGPQTFTSCRIEAEEWHFRRVQQSAPLSFDQSSRRPQVARWPLAKWPGDPRWPSTLKFCILIYWQCSTRLTKSARVSLLKPTSIECIWTSWNASCWPSTLLLRDANQKKLWLFLKINCRRRFFLD